jgi:hypothetical protein
MLRLLLLSCALLLLASAATQRPGPEKTFVRLLKKDRIQELFADADQIFISESACAEMACDKFPRRVKGKELFVAGMEDLFMRNFPLTIYVDDVFDEDGDWGISFHVQKGHGSRAEVVFRGTYVR